MWCVPCVCWRDRGGWDGGGDAQQGRCVASLASATSKQLGWENGKPNTVREDGPHLTQHAPMSCPVLLLQPLTAPSCSLCALACVSPQDTGSKDKKKGGSKYDSKYEL